MSNKKRIGLILIALIMLISVFATGCASKPAEEEKTFVLKVGHDQNTEHYYHKGLEKFKEGVESRSEGRIIVEIYPQSQLGSHRSAVEGVATGTIEMFLTNTMTLGGWLPEYGVYDLPFIFENREQAYGVLDGPITDELNAKIEEEGIKVLAVWENGFRHITSKIPLNTPADAKGLKIRVPESPVYIDTFTALGAAPTPLAFNELFTALQTGIVDAQENPAGHAVVNRFFEVVDYLNLTGHIYTPEPLVISKIVWDTLPADLQTIVQEEAIVARDFERQLSSSIEQDYIDQLVVEGMTVVEPDIQAFKDAVAPVYEKYADTLGETLAKIQAEINK